MTTPEIALAVSIVIAVGTNAAIVSRWGAKLSAQVAEAAKHAMDNSVRIAEHEKQAQHGPSAYVTQSMFESIQDGRTKLSEERFSNLYQRLDKIDSSIAALSNGQAQMLQNMMDITRQTTEELKRATAARL
jgi:hypothetical protein